MFVAVIVCVVLPFTVTALQPDCCALGFGDTKLSNGKWRHAIYTESHEHDSAGTSLDVCTSDGDQCCGSNYIDIILMPRVRAALETYLRKAYRDGISYSVAKLDSLSKCESYVVHQPHCHANYITID